MRTWKDLTHDERETYYSFLITKKHLRMSILLLDGISLLFLGMGGALAFIDSFLYVSMFMFLIGGLLLISLTFEKIESEKYLKLVFGYSSAQRELFGINKSDMKKIRKKFVWVKDDEI